MPCHFIFSNGVKVINNTTKVVVRSATGLESTIEKSHPTIAWLKGIDLKNGLTCIKTNANYHMFVQSEEIPKYSNWLKQVF